MPVDLTTAPVRDGDRLVGAVMTFTDRRPYEELIARHEAERAEQAERYAALASRYAELSAALAGFRPDPSEALAASGTEAGRRETATVTVTRHPTTLGTIVTAGIDKASALTGPQRTQFAVHAPPVVVALDPARASTALAHLIADASGVSSAGSARPRARAVPRADDTVVITAALRGGDLRIEISGPRAVNDPATSSSRAASSTPTAENSPPGNTPRTTDSPTSSGSRTQPRPRPRSRTSRTPAPASRPAPPRVVPAPVAGSSIIGAAVGAHRDRAAARSRPYALPVEQSPGGWAGGDEAAQQRIVHLLARIRSHSA
ncbi:hypothetical protein [Streptomyces sp. NPDC046371]|uniref:hypothetical protein n=1 Tax=Streptomyces sp. NPDC046371 TaxID=3154916 RepID=UPI0033D6285B